MKNNEAIIKIQNILEKHPEYKRKLFVRGYIVSNDKYGSINEFPFYSNWNEFVFGDFNIRVHKDQHIYYYGNENKSLILIGNCVNPFSLVYDESKIVKKIFLNIKNNLNDAISYINELTGSFVIIYIAGDKISFLSDPSGMLFGCYAMINKKFYMSSHSQMIGDLCNLCKDRYTERMESYKYFYKYGLFFPGDHTQFPEVNRIMQNHIFSYESGNILFERFYPTDELKLCETDKEYTNLVENVFEILHNTMQCVSKKWRNPAISLTGGMDSKTTLASTNGLYDKFKYYSYVSMDGDKIDADAAHSISNHLGLEHNIFYISDNDSDFQNIDIMRAVIEHNNGGYRINDNDARKRFFFNNSFPYDVEVKSWVSEIARANYYKKFGLKKMPLHLSPRNMTSMYKIFLYQRKLARETDSIFAEFIEKSDFNNIPEGYDASDMYLWEFRYSAWGGQVITSEHLFSNEIFIPYNNRNLLNLMLTAPQEKRISDQFHEDLIRYGNKKISDTNITITNWNETRLRMYVEKMYFLINSHIF